MAEGTGRPQGTVTSPHFSNSVSKGLFLPIPFVECFPGGGLSIYYEGSTNKKSVPNSTQKFVFKRDYEKSPLPPSIRILFRGLLLREALIQRGLILMQSNIDRWFSIARGGCS